MFEKRRQKAREEEVGNKRQSRKETKQQKRPRKNMSRKREKEHDAKVYKDL